MNNYEKKVRDFITKSNLVNAQHFVFAQSCHSVKEAAKTVDACEKYFVKNICMINKKDDELIVAIVRGVDRASTTHVAKALNIERPRLANEKEIFELTGFPAGGVPSFGFEANFLIDPKVVKMDFVYTGGGSPHSLLRICVDDLLKLTSNQIVKVSK